VIAKLDLSFAICKTAVLQNSSFAMTRDGILQKQKQKQKQNSVLLLFLQNE
jgi:hypothetical protein